MKTDTGETELAKSISMATFQIQVEKKSINLK
jgi:hypothetical protein